MKKYRNINKTDLEDDLYKILEKYDLTEEEKVEVDIIINSYSSILQKINKNIKENKFENLKTYVLKYLKQEKNVWY